jgi:hypothetical protein
MKKSSSPAPTVTAESLSTLPGAASHSLALAIAALAWLSFAAQADIVIGWLATRGIGPIGAIGSMSRYLTNLSVLACAICFSCVATRARLPLARFCRTPAVVTAIVAYMVFVGIAYNLLLRGLWVRMGYRALVNESLHTVLPLLSALYWLLFVPRFQFTLRQCALSFVFPLAYLALTMWRGSVSDFYPYPFLDVVELGYERVLLNVALLMLAFLGLYAVLFAINRRRSLRPVRTVSCPGCGPGSR